MTDTSKEKTPLEQAREFVVLFLAFTGRDQGTPREEKTMSQLQEMAAKLDDDLLAAINAPSAGTSAYEMLAMSATAELDTIEQLLYMTAATVLSKLIDDEGGGRINITFSPQDMDLMLQRYDLETSRDGMNTTVVLKPKPEAFGTKPPASLYRDPTVAEDDTPALPQVLAHKPEDERPLWAARINGKLFPASTKQQAEKMVTANSNPERVAQVENRFCYHKDCPAEHCNHTK